MFTKKIILISKLKFHEIYGLKLKKIKTIGRHGQGPGEFMLLRGIQITPDKELIAFDHMSRKLSFFTLGGNFNKSISIGGIKGPASLLYMDLRKKIIVDYATFAPNNNILVEVNAYDSDWKFIRTLASKEHIQAPVSSFLTWQLVNNEYVIYGDNATYELVILDVDLNIAKRIIKEYDRVEVNKEELEKRLGRPLKPNEKLPKYYPAFGHFTVDEANRIYVQTWEIPIEKEGYYYDVFDAEGRFITKILFKRQIRPCWKNNKIYTIEEDEEGFPVVKRYKVTWKF